MAEWVRVACKLHCKPCIEHYDKTVDLRAVQKQSIARVHITLGIVPLAKPMIAIWPPHLSVFSASVKGTPPTGSNTTSIPAATPR